MEKLSGREVHANRQGRCARVALLPDTCLLASLSEHPLPDPHDQTRLLGDREKHLGQQQSPLRVFPTHQCLYPGDLVVIQCHDGLVVNTELLSYESAPEPRLQYQALHGLGIHAGLEHFVASLASMFGSVHRQVCVPQEIRRLLLSSAVEGDPGAGGDEHLVFFESEGRSQYVRDPLRYLNYLIYTRNILNQDSELIPAEARGGVFGTQASLYTFG